MSANRTRGIFTGRTNGIGPPPRGWKKLTNFVYLLIFRIFNFFFSCVRQYSTRPFLNIRKGLLHGIRAVSYTHLDVYKRQGLYRLRHCVTVVSSCNSTCAANNQIFVFSSLRHGRTSDTRHTICNGYNE